MRKLFLLIVSHSLAAIIFSQDKLPNPKIGKNETEISLVYLLDSYKSYPTKSRQALGGSVVYRWSLKKYTKAGAGFLIAADFPNYGKGLQPDVIPYGAMFADIMQFLGRRQKWSMNGQIGYSIYNREAGFDDSTLKYTDRITGGMYYSISLNCRMIIAKKILLNLSTSLVLRNFQNTTIEEFHSPPSVQENKEVQSHTGFGFKAGIVF
jgi:hypothetical protein